MDLQREMGGYSLLHRGDCMRETRFDAVGEEDDEEAQETRVMNQRLNLSAIHPLTKTSVEEGEEGGMKAHSLKRPLSVLVTATMPMPVAQVMGQLMSLQCKLHPPLLRRHCSFNKDGRWLVQTSLRRSRRRR